MDRLVTTRASKDPIPDQETDESTREALRALGYVQ